MTRYGTVVIVALALVVVALIAAPAAAQLPGEPSAPKPYDPVADMRYTFALGAPDETVRTAQRLLSDLGYYTGPFDGRLGPAERRAILAFQKANGLRPTGSLDRLTLIALDPDAPLAAASPALDFAAPPHARPAEATSIEAP